MELTPQELRRITGYTQGKRQTEALEAMGFVRGRDFRVRKNGTPIVTWDAFKPGDPSSSAGSGPRIERIRGQKTQAQS